MWALGGTTGDEGLWADSRSRGQGVLGLRLCRVTAAGFGGLRLPSDRKDEGQGSRWGCKPALSPGSSGYRAWSLRCGGAQTGEAPRLLSAELHPRTRSGAQAPPLARILGSFGFRAGRAQRAPHPGDVKLAAGKKELHPSIPSAMGPHSLPAWLPGYEDPQPWGSNWVLRYLLVTPTHWQGNGT